MADLAKKLQIKVGNRVGVVNAPADFTLGNLPQDVTLVMGVEPELDVALLFAQDSKVLKRDAAATLSALKLF